MTVDRPLQRQAMRFLREEAGFAQLVTVTTDGFPVARTVGAQVNDDWSVDLVQRKAHRRLAQLRRNPRLELVWVGSPAPGSTNERPAVFDFGLLVPRVVLLRGIAEPMDGDRTVQCYQRLSSRQRALGLTRAPLRSVENVRAELAGIHVRPVRVRVEGFGRGAQSFAWTVTEST